MFINFQILTPERKVYEDAIASVTIPTPHGEITILPNHIPYVSIIAPGELVIRKNGAEDVYMAVAGGFITVHRGSSVVVLADTAERAEELNISAIEAARERARHLLEEKRNMDDVAFADAALSLERELARLRVARKYRKTRTATNVPETE